MTSAKAAYVQGFLLGFLLGPGAILLLSMLETEEDRAARAFRAVLS